MDTATIVALRPTNLAGNSFRIQDTKGGDLRGVFDPEKRVVTVTDWQVSSRMDGYILVKILSRALDEAGLTRPHYDLDRLDAHSRLCFQGCREGMHLRMAIESLPKPTGRGSLTVRPRLYFGWIRLIQCLQGRPHATPSTEAAELFGRLVEPSSALPWFPFVYSKLSQREGSGPVAQLLTLMAEHPVEHCGALSALFVLATGLEEGPNGDRARATTATWVRRLSTSSENPPRRTALPLQNL